MEILTYLTIGLKYIPRKPILAIQEILFFVINFHKPHLKPYRPLRFICFCAEFDMFAIYNLIWITVPVSFDNISLMLQYIKNHPNSSLMSKSLRDHIDCIYLHMNLATDIHVHYYLCLLMHTCKHKYTFLLSCLSIKSCYPILCTTICYFWFNFVIIKYYLLYSILFCVARIIC